jgi:hypothetical protein
MNQTDHASCSVFCARVRRNAIMNNFLLTATQLQKAAATRNEEEDLR